MFKKSIKYVNFNGDEVERDFYFHLSKAELLDIGAGNIQERINRILATKDTAGILAEFKALIHMSVGVRSEDGETFIKDERAQQLLIFSPAYDELLFELLADAGKATEFIKGLVPEKMQKEIQDQLVAQGEGVEDTRPLWVREDRDPTPAELKAMTPEEMQAAFARRMTKKV